MKTLLHCKNVRIFTDILWQVFHILTELVPCAFVSVNRRNNEARLATKYPWIYGYFYSVIINAVLHMSNITPHVFSNSFPGIIRD